jgi:hypothetical protein
MSLSRDQLSTISTALFCHERTCDVRADQLLSERSSDKSYEANAYLCEQARSYREFAARMRDTRETVNAMLASEEK